MDPDLDRSLCSRYPAIFRERHAAARRTAMCWGFCCGNGWYALIDTLCDEIQRRVDTHGVKDVVALQVKEKFGGLRFYVSGGDEYTAGLIWLADHLSTMVCEDCGAPGLQTGSDWIKTRCAMHDGEDFPLDQTMSYGEGDLVEGLRSVSPERLQAWDLASQFRLPPVRTRGWRHISYALEAVIRNDIRHNELPGVVVDAHDESEGLRFHWLGGDDRGRVAGMFRLAETYAARCDRQTGKPTS